MRHLRRRAIDLPRMIDRAVERSAFRPTVFKIYDKSSDTVCDRLIVVEPFDWYVWACRGQLFVLNPEGGSVKCQAGTTPAVRVLEKQFYETCVNLDLDTLLRAYTTTGVYKEVPYEIEGTVFTVLSALNILCKDWITFVKSDGEDDASKPRVRRSTLEREIDGDAFLRRFMNRPTHQSHSQLLQQYELHTSDDNRNRFRHVTDRVRLKERVSLRTRTIEIDDDDDDDNNVSRISSRD